MTTSVQEWEWIRNLGDGGFGQVMLWRHKSTNQEIATKCLKTNRSLPIEQVEKIKSRWTKEINWIQRVNTPYIVGAVNLNGNVFEPYFHGREENGWNMPIITMEYCNGGDLRTLLQRSDNVNGLHEQEVRDVMRALSKAIHYLHNVCGVEHRDLKPDNIVIHRTGHSRSYKLTDFGFTRDRSDSTILKSVVGTCHYFAPEVVDTAQYTHTVDYWSAGVIAFEIMCGCIPFIPHQSLYNIITNIKYKPSSCVAIVESMNDSNTFLFEEHVFAETRMTPIFLQRMECWLRLALDKNYKTRGRAARASATDEVQVANNGQHGECDFYSMLDAILQTRVLRAFCLNTGKFYYYEITPNKTMKSLSDNIQTDTRLPDFNIILPVGHPHQQIMPNSRPVNLFVEEWQDTSKSDTPPAMIYIVRMQNSFEVGNPRITNEIKSLMKLPVDAKLPNWKLKTFTLHTHFLLSYEQRHLEAHSHGLKEFAMFLEQDILDYEHFVMEVSKRVQWMVGKMKQFHRMIDSAKRSNGSETLDYGQFHAEWQVHYEKLLRNQSILSQTDCSITKRYKSALRRAKEQAQSTQFIKWINDDIYNLSKFRNDMQTNGKIMSIRKLQESVEYCLQHRHHFYTSSTFTNEQNTIYNIVIEIDKIKESLKNAIKCVEQLDENILEATDKFHVSLKLNQTAAIPILNSDGAIKSISNGFNSDSFDDRDTVDLIAETMKYVQLCKSVPMVVEDDDDDISQKTEVPPPCDTLPNQQQ